MRTQKCRHPRRHRHRKAPTPTARHTDKRQADRQRQENTDTETHQRDTNRNRNRHGQAGKTDEQAGRQTWRQLHRQREGPERQRDKPGRGGGRRERETNEEGLPVVLSVVLSVCMRNIVFFKVKGYFVSAQGVEERILNSIIIIFIIIIIQNEKYP